MQRTHPAATEVAGRDRRSERTSAWIGVLAVWLALLSAGFYVSSVDTAAHEFKGRIIGHAVMFGVDPALRIRAYVIVCALSVAVAALVIVVLHCLQAWSAARGHMLLGRAEQHGAILLGLTGIGDLLLSLLTAAPAYRNGALFLLLCTALLATGPLVRLATHGRARAFGAPLTQAATLLLAYQLSTGVGVLFELPLILGLAAVLRFLAIWLALEIIVAATLRNPSILPPSPYEGEGRGEVLAHEQPTPDRPLFTLSSDPLSAAHRRTAGSLLHATMPLLWLPALGPLANELQFMLRAHVTWTPLTLARVTALALAALAAVRWFRVQPSLSTRGALRLLRRRYVPIVVISSALLTLHRQTMTLDAVDAYHHGEMTTPVMEILRQGRIPYLDACLPHGFMDVVPQLLFGLINGSTNLDILIWGSGHWAGWLTITAAVGLVYALLVTVTSPLAALLLLLFLPAELLVPFPYAPLLLCALALQEFLRQRGVRRAWLLPAALLAAFFWRVDFGIATLTAAAATLAVVAWSCRHVRWIRLLEASGAFVVGTAALAVMLAAAHGVALRAALHDFLTYVRIQVAVASYSTVYDTMSALVILQYVVLPAIGLLIVLWFGMRALLARRCQSPRAYSLLFVAVLSLVLLVRSLQRHSLIEGVFSPHLFLFLLAALPVLGQRRRRGLVAVLLVAVSVAAALGLPDARLLSKDVKWPAIAGGPPRFDYRTWGPGDRRVLVLDTHTDDVVRVLRAQLKPGQTFYDFANAPLLYFLSGAPPPSYIIDSSYYAGDDLQYALIDQLDTLRRADRLPLVVFRQHTAFDAVDGIADEVRSYRVAEYLYTHYVPWTNAGRFELWIDKRLAPLTPSLPTGLEGAVVARYPLALRTPTAAANVTVHPTATAGLTLAATGEPAWVEGLFVLPEQVVWKPGVVYHLHLRYITHEATIVQTVFRFSDTAASTESSAEVITVPTTEDNPADLHVPLGLGATQPPALTDIRLLLPRGSALTITAAELEVRQLPPDAPAAWAWSPVAEPYAQQFDLFRLPYVWANFDAHDPAHTASELQVLYDGAPLEITPGQERSFSVHPASMAAGQYLDLRLQAATAATVTVAYGDGPQPDTFSMQVDATPEPHDYLIRLSMQREWHRGTTTALRLSASAPARLFNLRLLPGD